jgi:hypothetical protein
MQSAHCERGFPAHPDRRWCPNSRAAILRFSESVNIRLWGNSAGGSEVLLFAAELDFGVDETPDPAVTIRKRLVALSNCAGLQRAKLEKQIVSAILSPQSETKV